MLRAQKITFLLVPIIAMVLLSCQEDASGPVGEIDEQIVGTWNSTRHVLSACEGTADYEVTTEAIRLVFASDGSYEEFKVSSQTSLKVAEGIFSTEDFMISFLEVEPELADVTLFGVRGTYAYVIGEAGLQIEFGDIDTETVSCEGTVFFSNID